MKRTVILGVSLFVTMMAAFAQPSKENYLNRNLPAEARAEDLLKRLTLEEKTSLMMNNSAAVHRLGIKKYNWWNEALHGVARNGSATVYPQPIGMAASFDEPLVRMVFTAVSDEARVKNAAARREGDYEIYKGLTFWTPNINIFRDPRWGRGMETYGEDPYLTSVLGCAVVRGLQDDEGSEMEKTHACAKHYAVHSGPESTRHSYDARISERDLRETYLPAFKALVTKAGVREVMTAYNRLDGVPCGASGRLVKNILRGEWGYKGLVVSDCGAVNDFFEPDRHNYVESAAAAAAAAVKNGMNIECGSVFNHIPEAVRQGLLTEEDVDRCLLQLLAERYRLGEMDGESLWDNLAEDMVEGPEHREMSLKMARESMVLLQNRGGLLPLAEGEKVALIGPNADDKEMMWGNYNAVPNNTVTLLDALRSRLGDVKYLRACGVVDSKYAFESTHGLDLTVLSPEQLKETALRYGLSEHDMRNLVRQLNRMKDNFFPALDIPAVLDELEGYGTVIFAGGISPHIEGEEMPVAFPGFAGGDRTDIELPDVQRRLLKALHDAGKKVILVNFSGSAIGLVPETQTCDAILQAWYPGQEGGTAIAEVLYGDINPSGKLPVTFYRSAAQLPDFENYDMEGHTYRYFRGEPLFPFGYGLSYTSFEYGKAKLNKKELRFNLRNTGRTDGTEVVQLYVSRPDDAEGPVRTLRAFRRVSVPSGKTVTVTIPLTDETFEWWDPDRQNIVPCHGRYLLQYGGNSAAAGLQSIEYVY